MTGCQFCGSRTGLHGFSFERAPDEECVCVVHLAFVPCRHGEPDSQCHTSTRADNVSVVRMYQNSLITQSQAHARIDRMELSNDPNSDRAPPPSD